MGGHQIQPLVLHTAADTVQPPPLDSGEIPRRPSPLLAALEPIHQERMAFFRAIQVELSDARDLAAVIVDENGYPMLSVVRVDGSRSLRIGAVYRGGTWYYATPDVPTFAPARHVSQAAAAIKAAMRA